MKFSLPYLPYLFLSSLLFLCININAQDTKLIKFNHLTTQDGLADNYCETILQDSKGFIWIGTNDGLCRYDGYNFRTYRNSPNDSTTLSNNYIFSLFEDSKQNLWVGTNMGGVALYNPSLDNFTRIIFNAEDSIWYQRNRINEMVEIGDNIWFATMHGFGRLNLETKETKWFKPEVFKGFSPHQIMCMLPDKDGHMWIGTLYGGLYYFDTHSEKIKKHYYNIPDDPTTLSSNKVKRFHQESDTAIWIGTEEGGINILNPYTGKCKRYQNNPLDETTIGSNDVLNFFKDSKERLWIGTINGGLNLYNKSNDSFTRFTPNKNNPSSLNAQSISKIIEDDFGNIWVSTHGGGINYINPKQNSFKHLHSSISKNANLKHNYISCFLEDNFSNIWVGTDGGGLHLYDRRNNTFKSFGEEDGIYSASILDIKPSTNNKIWIATWGSGIYLFDTELKKVIKHYTYTANKNSIGINDIKGIHEKNDTLWIATHGDGLNILDLKTEHFTSWRNNKSFNCNLHFPEWGNAVLNDSQDRIWIATTVGLHKYDNDTLTSYFKDNNDTTSLNGFMISCIYEDSRGKIWIGTEGGLNLYEEDNDHFIQFNNKYGLPTKVKSIIEDNENTFWIGSNYGITMFNYRTKNRVSKNYDEKDGLQGNQFFDRSCLKLKNGELLFGGLNGFNIFDPNKLTENKVPPHTYFIDFQIFNKSQYPTQDSSPLFKSITYTDEITIDYNQSVIGFEFCGINYIAPQKNTYKIIMEGFDNKWRNIGTERKATYTNLDPGVYTFKVKAANNEEVWNEAATKIRITVLPPWWMTWWFRISIVIILVSSAIFYYKYRMMQIKKINIKLENDVKERTDELLKANKSLQNYQLKIIDKNNELAHAIEELQSVNKTKDRFFSIIAHDLKNPINTIMGFSELLMLRKKVLPDTKKDNFISLIHDSSLRINDLLKNLLQWARSQTGTIQFNPKEHNLNTLIKGNIELLETMAHKKDISIHFHSSIDTKCSFDANMINTVLRNLGQNAIKFTNRNGEINFIAEENEDKYTITVSDNGEGISEEQIKKLLTSDYNESTDGTENEKGSGLGLILCKEFITAHNGTFEIKSTIGKGSKFIFSLPKLTVKE